MDNYSNNTVFQVTYDSEVELGYIYLNPPFINHVVKTEELIINPDILLDFDKNDHLLGLEIRGESVKKLEQWSGKNHVFNKLISENGQIYFSFILSDLPSIRTFALCNNNIIFHFSDCNYKEFLGLDIYDIDFYSESYLVDYR